MNTKICSKCGLEKPIEQFNKNNSKKDKLSSECKLCHNEICKKYYKHNKIKYRTRSKNYRNEIKDYINNLKKSGCCICHEKDISCLDFHHLNNKIDNISSMINNENLEAIKQEINKCVVICANCHRKLHFYNLSIEGAILKYGAHTT